MRVTAETKHLGASTSRGRQSRSPRSSVAGGSLARFSSAFGVSTVAPTCCAGTNRRDAGRSLRSRADGKSKCYHTTPRDRVWGRSDSCALHPCDDPNSCLFSPLCRYVYRCGDRDRVLGSRLLSAPPGPAPAATVTATPLRWPLLGHPALAAFQVSIEDPHGQRGPFRMAALAHSQLPLSA